MGRTLSWAAVSRLGVQTCNAVGCGMRRTQLSIGRKVKPCIADMWRQVENLARHAAPITRIPSKTLSAPRVKECPVHIEAVARKIHELKGEQRLHKPGVASAVEVE